MIIKGKSLFDDQLVSKERLGLSCGLFGGGSGRRERALEQNLSVAQLAEVVGRSRHSISGLLRRRGIASVGSVIEGGKPVALYPARAIIEATREASA